MKENDKMKEYKQMEDKILDCFPKEKKIDKMSRKILQRIGPTFKGESFEFVNDVLSRCQQLLREECLFSLRPSIRRRKT